MRLFSAGLHVVLEHLTCLALLPELSGGPKSLLCRSTTVLKSLFSRLTAQVKLHQRKVFFQSQG